MVDLESLLGNRRSVRVYTDKPVTDDLLDGILELGCRTSTTGNMQVYSIIVTRDEQKKRELAPCHFNQPMVTGAPVVLTFCADFNRFNKWCLAREAEPGYDNFLSFMTAAIDALLVAQTVCVAAEAKGMGICYLGTAIYNADKIIGVLKLPRGVVPVATVTLGWPGEETEQVDRLPLGAVVHKEEYNDFSVEMVNELYSAKESRSDSKRFIAENNKKTLAQVFTDVRYKKADNEYFSSVLLETIKKQGFLF